MARIKPKPMNRLPSGPGSSGAGPTTPTGTGASIATTPSTMVVSPGTIPLVAATPVQVAPVQVASKNGYPRQQQQQPPPQQQQQQPPQQQQQQPPVIPYATMLMPAQPLPGQPQQVGIVPAAGSAQSLPAVTGQPPNMVSMTATTMAQAPYHFVTSNSSAPNVHVSANSYNGAPTIIYVSTSILHC